jgi:ornithine carbamoyltransferase
MKKDFLTLRDFTKEELFDTIKLAIDMKKERYTGKYSKVLEGKKVALIFEKSSTRTRVSFEVGVYEMGGYPLFLGSNDLQLGRGESIQDTARVMERYVDMMMLRTFGHDKVVSLAKNSSIPVINGLTNEYHPCQVMADVMTIYEKLGKIEGLKVAYIGDGNNMAHSWLIGAALFGINISLVTPEGYECLPDIIDDAKEIAKQTGVTIETGYEPFDAVKDADVIYTDVWASMGQEDEAEERRRKFIKYQVNDELMKATGKSHTIFMHCLPAHIEEEVTQTVFESEASVVFDEAENRLHAQKAIMAKLVGYK